MQSERDDLRQEAYTALIQAGEKVTTPGLAYKISKDRIIDVLRKEKRVSKNELPLNNSDVAKSDFPDFAAGIDLRDALVKLDPDEQFVINALFYERKTGDETAVGIGKSRQWVWEKKASAIKKLRNELTRRANASKN